MSGRCSSILGTVCLSLVFATAAGAQSFESFDALVDFQAQNPGSSLYDSGGRFTRVYGRAFSFGNDPADSAGRFIAEHADLFGVEVADLAPLTWDDAGSNELPLMIDRGTGEAKFTLVRYGQSVDGIPVFRAQLKLLVRNEAGHPLVLASADLRDLGDFEVGRGAVVRTRRAQNKARNRMGVDQAEFTDGELVIWAGVDDMFVMPRLATVFSATVGTPADGEAYQRRLFVADVENGDILYDENRILHEDVVGNVSGLATQGNGADICGPEALEALPYARVNIQGGNTAFADVNGDFVIPHGGNSAVTVQSPVRGRYFRVFNQSGADTVLSQSVTPPGPVDFVHNAANNNELIRAEVNAYLHANVVRDYVLFYHPSYPVILNQLDWPVNVNLNSNCNAFYDFGSINFFTSGGGCPNTAYASVVYHEYGHHLVDVAGSGQGQYGEGMGDVMSVLILDIPELGIGFFNNCGNGLRNADNNHQYPCSGEVHDCGNLISGCVWHTRDALAASNPSTYRDIISSLAINSMPLHNGSSITPQITIDYLTLDDDDSDIGNGTPHYDEIDAGFSAHNMDAPPLSGLAFDYPDGRPDLIDPAGGTSFVVEVTSLTQDPQAGTGLVYIDTGSGFNASPLNELTDNVYEVVFPAVPCGTQVRYYVSAETTGGTEVANPLSAPDEFFVTISGAGLDIAFEDDFELDQGWTVSGNAPTGMWERGVPVGGGDRGDPASDYDGSGRCMLTQNDDGDSDIDGGSTTLTSPRFDATGGEAYLSYARWYDNSFGNAPESDIFEVEISNNDGTTWVDLETVGPGGIEVHGGWYFVTFKVSDFVSPTDVVRVRFTASDLGEGSVVEAGVDAVMINIVTCEGTSLVDLDILAGTLVSGGVDEIIGSDDDHLVVRSEFGFNVQEPTIADILVGASTTVDSPATLDVLIESRIDHQSGTAKIRLRNWSSNDLEQVGSYSIGTTEAVNSINGIGAADYVRGDGRIEVSVRHVVAATFTAQGFRSFYDQVKVNAN